MANANTTEQPTHVVDVISYFNCCSDKFGEIAAILSQIMDDQNAGHTAKKLASAAHYLANDFENISGAWGEEIEAMGVRS